MESDFLYYFVFAGIVQGFFLSLFILGSKKNKSKSSTYLGLLILAFTLTNLQYTLDELGVISWHLFNMLYLPYLFLLGPLLYFFVLFFLYPKRTIKPFERLLYIPTIFYMIVTLVYKTIALLTDKTASNNLFQEELGDLIDVYGDYVNIPFIILTIIILLIKIKNYAKAPKTNHFPDIINTELIWLKVLLWMLLLAMIPWMIYTYKYWQSEDTYYLPIFVLTSLIIYALGYIGIHKINILNQRHKIRSFINQSTNASTIEKSKSTHISKIEDIIVHDKRYLDPNISLDTLSEELQLSKSHLSRIINTKMNVSFSEYINSLRVEEAKKHLQNPEFSNYTLVAIGLESGFNSKTTFNTTFKKFTSYTPSQFRKNPIN